MIAQSHRRDLTHDLFLPTLLFVGLGAMTWAIRGCSGFGAMNGCLFAGVTWGAGWWFIAREPSACQTRPYNSGWIILALAVGIAYSGGRGWMQWPSFFQGHLQTNTAEGRWVPISRAYGFLWLFIAGVPWAGLGACALAWCGSHRRTRAWEWVVRLACGIGVAALARFLFKSYPEFFLPLYKSMAAQYADTHTNPNLRRLTGDCRLALMHLGLYLGFLGFEAARRDWRNVVLILTVGLVNGCGWALCQNWQWAAKVWPGTSFNFWRCWESSGGISIGLAYGLAYFLANRRIVPVSVQDSVASVRSAEPPSSYLPGQPSSAGERFGAYLGLLLGLGISIKNGLKGWANIYLGNERYWNHVFWMIIGPLMLVCLIALIIRIILKPRLENQPGDSFPHAYRLIWLVLIVQNIIAQIVTGPHTVWNETIFSIYYVLLFCLTAVIVHHYHCLQSMRPLPFLPKGAVKTAELATDLV